jgi:hypothetical protein
MPENIPSNGLDWQRFSAKHFPGRRRHDFEALTAYGAYKRPQTTGDGAQLVGAGHARPLQPEACTQNMSAPNSTALEAWEDEGGQ